MLGIDVSKAQLTCTLVDPQTEKNRWCREVPNTPAGIEQLLRRTPAEVAWVVEPTGRYSSLVARQATAAGRLVLLAQPQRAKKFLASVYDQVKTDRVDSRGLALYGLSRRLRPYPLKSETVEQLDQLQSARRGLSSAISRLEQQAKALPHAAAGLQAALVDLRARRAAFDREIAALVKTSEFGPLAARLQEVPGIGPVTGPALAACLSGKQFPHPDQFVSYLGLSVTRNSSGQRESPAYLSKRGNAELRRLLFLAAKSNVCCRNSPFRAQYERERAKGLPATAALCAVARKMARTCWSLWKHDTHYEPNRVHRQPAEYGGREPDIEPAS